MFLNLFGKKNVATKKNKAVYKLTPNSLDKMRRIDIYKYLSIDYIDRFGNFNKEKFELEMNNLINANINIKMVQSFLSTARLFYKNQTGHSFVAEKDKIANIHAIPSTDVIPFEEIISNQNVNTQVTAPAVAEDNDLVTSKEIENTTPIVESDEEEQIEYNMDEFNIIYSDYKNNPDNFDLKKSLAFYNLVIKLMARFEEEEKKVTDKKTREYIINSYANLNSLKNNLSIRYNKMLSSSDEKKKDNLVEKEEKAKELANNRALLENLKNNNLPTNEKDIKDAIINLLNNPKPGKNRLVIYNNEKYHLTPEDYNMYTRLIGNLNKALAAEKIVEPEDRNLLINKEIKAVEDKISYILNNPRFSLAKYTMRFNGEKYKVGKKDSEEIANLKIKLRELKEIRNNTKAVASININVNKKVVVKSSKKPKKNIGIKSKIAIALATFGIIGALSANNNQIVDKTVMPNITDVIEQSVTPEDEITFNHSSVLPIYKSELNNDMQNVMKEHKENILINSSINIGDSITLKEGFKIYNDVYDAADKTNASNPYFENDIPRTVRALFFINNNDIVTIWDYHEDYENEINSLISKGYELKGAITAANDSYIPEGAFNIEDINSLSKGAR